MRRYRQFLLVGMAVTIGCPAFAANITDEDDLSQVYGDKNTVSVASGSAQPLARAPSVATVLTSADIEGMGARDLNDVLAQVPGLHISYNFGHDPIYIFRGIHSTYNPQVLMLINGMPITSVFLGDRGNVWGSMPVDDIARIEVVRGPGSALHGADALAGVISIYTKDPDYKPGTTTRVDAGSFDTYSANLRHAGRVNDLGVAAYLRVGRTKGYDSTLEADAQTALDQLFSSNASLAPGKTSNMMRELDTALDMKYRAFQWRTAYKKRVDIGTGPGVADALDPWGRSSTEVLTSDLSWSAPKFTQNLGLSAQFQYLDRHEYSNLVLFPPGAFGGSFPQGMIGRPEKWERRHALSAAATYTGWQDHRIRLGIGAADHDIYRVREEKNFTYTYVMGVGYVPTPLGSIVDVSDSTPFLRPHSRSLRYAYIQDEWRLTRDLSLTGGVRHDSYSDFGGTTNPRLALVWEARYDLTTKLLYGKGFRPPSFAELYNINNPVATGNSQLRPETVETIEAAAAWSASDRLRVNFNLFQYMMRDILRFAPNSDPTTGNTAQNAGRQRGQGFELEASWDASSRLRISGNYAYQYATNPDTGRQAANAARNRIYLRSDWQFQPGWWLGPQVTHVGKRMRDTGDTRAPLEGYTLVDVAIRNTNLLPHTTMSLVLRNLFDADAREPSLSPGRIPNDLPLPGRSLFFNATYSF